MTTDQNRSLKIGSKGKSGWSSKRETSQNQNPQTLPAASQFGKSVERLGSPSGTSVDRTPENYSRMDISSDVSSDFSFQHPSTTAEDSSAQTFLTSSCVTNPHTAIDPRTTFFRTERDNLLHDITKFDLTKLKHVVKRKHPHEQDESPYCGIIDWMPAPRRYLENYSSDDNDDEDDDEDDWDD